MSQGVLLDPRTGRPEGRSTIDAVRGMLDVEAHAARRDGLKAILESLARSRDLGREQPMMGYQVWRQLGLTGSDPDLIADATAVTGTSEALAYPKDYVIVPANFFFTGRSVKLTMSGKITTAASAPGTLTLTPRFGTTTGGTSLGTMVTPTLATSQTNLTWQFEAWITCRSIGSSGSVIGFGHFSSPSGLFAATGNSMFPASGAAATTIDTTGAQGIVCGVTLGSASDSLTCMQVLLESLN